MSEIHDFCAEYNGLILGDEKCAYFSIVQGDTRWRSFVAPIDDADRITAAISGIAHGLPTGSHVLFLQAVAQLGGIMGQLSITVDGRSQAAKKAHSDQLPTVRGSQLIVETAEKQIDLAMNRAEQAERRAQTLQAALNERDVAQMTLMETCTKMIWDQERAQLDEEERRARIEAIQAIALTFAPVANAIAEMGAEALAHKRERDRATRAAEKATWGEPPKETTKEEKTNDRTEPSPTN